MTDLEMTRLCAEAMGLALRPRIGARNITCANQDLLETTWGEQYEPLVDDAQAMALVKKFKLVIGPDGSCPECDYWATTWINKSRAKGQRSVAIRKQITLNRAIVECVAEMQARRADRGRG